MTVGDTNILCVLPAREGFSPNAFGAVSLSVKDFAQHSLYRRNTLIVGQVPTEPYADLNYEALPIKRRWYERSSSAYARSIAARCQSYAPSLIEVHNRPILALKLSKQCRAPIALHLHNDPQEMRHAKTAMQRSRLLKKLAGVYCVSEWVKARFLQGLPETAASKLHVVPCGIRIPEKPTQKHPQILYVGRITPNKGVLEFCQGLAVSLDAHPSWHGLLIGGRRHASTEKLSEYERSVVRIAASYTNIDHRGFQPFDVAQKAFRSAAIAVVPSLWQEPFGRTTLEAMSQGCAVISSGRGGQKEILGDTGYVLGDVNEQTVAQAINTLIEDPERLQALQDAAYERAKHFSIEACTKALDTARQHITGQAGRAPAQT